MSYILAMENPDRIGLGTASSGIPIETYLSIELLSRHVSRRIVLRTKMQLIHSAIHVDAPYVLLLRRMQ